MYVLGIETSCDETGIAIYDSEARQVEHELYSQVKIHAQYGGVVPELASRDHVTKILPLIQALLKKTQLDLADINGVAYTAGPGLVGALLVGAATAHSLAWGLDVPVVAVHHMEGHLLAPFLDSENLDYPFIALLVSGGHTLLVEVRAFGGYRILGESLDDAAGEAFDKVAKMLGLGYPGGPAIAQLAERGDPDRFRFPRPMTDRPGLALSFSGLKTYSINKFKAEGMAAKADIARAFQEAVVDTLAIKCTRALKMTGLTRLVVAGGVSANASLRHKLTGLMASMGGEVFFPKAEFCTDNGAMIAYAGYLRLQSGQRESLPFQVRPRWPLDSL